LAKNPNMKEARVALQKLAPNDRQLRSRQIKQRETPARAEQARARSKSGKVGPAAQTQRRLPFLRWPIVGNDQPKEKPRSERIANKPKKASGGGIREFFHRLLPSRSSNKAAGGVVRQTSVSSTPSPLPVAGSKTRQ